jgi:hypothetical protein
MPRHDDYDPDGDRDRDDDRPMPRRDRDPYQDRYDDYDDYDDRPRRGTRRAALDKVSLPAIFLMVIGGLGVLFAIVRTILDQAFGGNAGQNPFGPPNNDPAMKKIEEIAMIVGPILNLAWGIIVFVGGLQMKRLSSRGFVFFSCIWAMLPCTVCCVLGIPFGIWGLVAISDENVKRYM